MNQKKVEMRIPKGKTKNKKKKCQFPGCNKNFIGHPVAKFCPAHRDPKKRQLKKKKTKSESSNITIKHNYTDMVPMILTCKLDGCINQYEIMIYPKQYIYPAYCNKHRSDFKREQFVKSKK